MTAIVDSSVTDEMEAHFIGRNDQILRWSLAISQMQMLPGLRGLWPMSAFDSTPLIYDLSMQNRNLTYNGNPTFSYNQYGRVPFIDFDGTGDSLSRASAAGLSITGTEAYVATAAQGLTFGGWFWVDAITGIDFFMSKWLGSGNQRSYSLDINGATNAYRFRVSDDGTNIENITHSGTFANGAWHHIIGRWNSSNLSIQVDGVLESQATAFASVFASSADFYIGGWAGGGNQLDGRASLCHLNATGFPDGLMAALYHSQKHFFGIA